MTITVDATARVATSENPQYTVSELDGRMFAFRASTGAVLAEAERRGLGPEDEWFGWRIVAPCQPTVIVDNRTLARYIVEEYARNVIGGVR